MSFGGRELCASIARILDNAQVPNVLWGRLLESAYGFMDHLNLPVVSFIIPDKMIDSAYQALMTEPLLNECKGEHCEHYYHQSGDPRERTMKPARHLYLPLDLNMKYYHPYIVLELYRESDILLGFPAIPLGTPPHHDEYYMSTDDKRLPDIMGDCGRFNHPKGNGDETFNPEKYPFKVLTVTKAVENLILLRCRDKGYHEHCDRLWSEMLEHIRIQVVGCGTVEIGKLEEGFQKIWDNTGVMNRSPDSLVDDLREKLKEENALPPPLPNDDCGCRPEQEEKI
ncbi:hypothetical protein BO94DRAFT_218645 [Aspergillus sclerotioniger CBS 115572]|uniref:Uncharacterized protein n=1 Tax=Aspergillus sclerotioniger CBS 115572 TaxID=1450535 RepID=A0A317X9C5_9EURO|nr:hypothetical protein BO94DRAFT_218645 [Aspergillus sclerotioniger CBS 115572]PWY95099.1 hypothetical protein BO94DRAFT_218645 [Aspergillus sclerotioniger CBS 115572]